MPGLLDLFLPVSCCGCGASPSPDVRSADALVCPACRTAVRGPCLARLLGPPDLLAVAATAYDGPARRLLLEYKELGRRPLARPLGAALARAVEEVIRSAAVAGTDPGATGRTGAGRRPGARIVLVPVPSRAAARRARGFDHVALLARAAAASSSAGWAVRPVLAASRARRDQAGLDAAARAANIRGAWRPTGRLPSGLIVLVDDVVTTGATAREVGRVLCGAGARVLGMAAVAGVAGPGSPPNGPGAGAAHRASV